MTDFEKARDKSAKSAGGDTYETAWFVRGADWAHAEAKKEIKQLKLECSNLESDFISRIKMNVEALEIVEACVKALKHADRYIDYAMEFDDASKNTVGIEIVKETLERAKKWVGG